MSSSDDSSDSDDDCYKLYESSKDDLLLNKDDKDKKNNNNNKYDQRRYQSYLLKTEINNNKNSYRQNAEIEENGDTEDNLAHLNKVASWQKHTTGFGMKMLMKFGFKGRLGANENGIKESLTVIPRGSNVGVGYEKNEFKKEKKKSHQNTIATSSSSILSSNSNTNLQQKRKFNVAFTNIEDPYSSTSYSNEKFVIDMRYEDNISNSNNDAPSLGAELLYNIDQICNDMKDQTLKLKFEISSSYKLKSSIESDMQVLLVSIQSVNKSIDHQNGLLFLLKTIQTLIRNSNFDIHSFSNAILNVLSRFPDEASLMGVTNIVETVITKKIRFDMDEWLKSPLTNPQALFHHFIQWNKLIIDGESDSSMVRVLHDKIRTCYGKCCHDSVRQALLNVWQVEDLSGHILMKSLKFVLSDSSFMNILDMILLPKLRNAILNIKADATDEIRNMHTWLLIWTDTLGSLRFKTLLSDILNKLVNLIRILKLSNEVCLKVIQIWKQGLQKLDEALYTTFHRRISSMLSDELRKIDVRNEANIDEASISTILSCNTLLPIETFIKIVNEDLLDRWIRAFTADMRNNINAIGSSNSNIIMSKGRKNVINIYSKWRRSIPAGIIEIPAVYAYFNYVLDYLN